jgi:hypothetical protein
VHVYFDSAVGTSQKVICTRYALLGLCERERSAPQLRNAFILCSKSCLKRVLSRFQLGLRLVDRFFAHSRLHGMLEIGLVLSVEAAFQSWLRYVDPSRLSSLALRQN